MVDLKKKKDKLIILGMCPTWKDAPITNVQYDVWGMNNLWSLFEREVKNETINYNPMEYIDLWWEIHTLETRKPEHLNWLKNINIVPVMMQKAFPDIPNSIEYPLEEILKKFKRRYYLCTMNYQIAYAIMQGYKEIIMAGFNMMMTDDFIQKWSVEYYLGRAEQKGINLIFPEGCDLLTSPKLYGYEASNTLGVYMQRYISAKEAEDLTKIKTILDYALDIMGNMSVLYYDRKKFMKEIYDRHGLTPNLSDDDWGGDY